MQIFFLRKYFDRRKISEWLDAEDLNSDSIYNLYFANKEFRFKDPKGMLCPYGCEGGDVFLEDIYLEKDLREKQVDMVF